MPLGTPSRLWREIEEAEDHSGNVSLPPLPPLDSETDADSGDFSSAPIRQTEQQSPARRSQRSESNFDGDLTPVVDATAEPYPSPGMGRLGKSHLSKGSTFNDFDRVLQETPANLNAQASESRASDVATSTPRLAAFATPKPPLSSTPASLEQRKTHLLSALRLTALRSEARPRLAKGTPHPHRPSRLASVTPLSVIDSDDDASETTSNDLTTLPRVHANTSMPTADRSTRFNGAKLNAYLHTLNTHLTTENQVRKAPHIGGQTESDVSDLQNLIKTLQEATEELNRLRHEQHLDDDEEANRSAALNAGLKNLLQSHGNIDDMRKRLAGKMAPADRTEDDGDDRIDELQEQIADLEARLEATVADKEAQRTELETKEAELRALQSRNRELEERVDRTEDEGADRVDELQDRVARLEATVADKEAQLRDAAEQQDTLKRRVSDLERADATAQRRVETQQKNLQQMEEALDESERQMLETDQELNRLRNELRDAKAEIARLEAADERTTSTSNERSQLAQDTSHVERLEAQLDAAGREVGRLRALAEAPSVRMELEIKEVEFRALQSRNRELEERVASLREQNASFLATPMKADRSIEKSVRFQPIVGIRTPKTPGAFLNNVRNPCPCRVVGFYTDA
jgi:predicted  nucleic acid-binding Zn-ribbon protein